MRQSKTRKENQYEIKKNIKCYSLCRYGNFTLTEALAVVDKGKDTNPLAMEMVQCIIEKGRTDLMTYYPVPLYDGETADSNAISANSKTFPEALTVELLEKHRAISEECK